MGDDKQTSYDDIPYEGHPFAQTHPDRMATVARLMGLETPPVEHCRVLELGCADGGNLIPMAAALSESAFVGIDLSGRQIADGQKVVDGLGLKNIELRHMSISDVNGDLGEFDYIICHGVYSWVPPDVQTKIFEVCARHLSPRGVAYVSYNTYPGWHLRGMARDMMYYHAKQYNDPKVRVQQARNLLNFLAKSAAQQNNPYSLLLQAELKVVQQSRDSYIFHEHLEEVNQPLYFYQFAERAAAQGLQYLGEADICAMAPANFPVEVQNVLQVLATDVIHLEQYMDFLRNRTFRQTLLCRSGIRLGRHLRPDDVARFYAASPAKPVHSQLDLHSADPEEFRTPDGAVFSVNHQLCKAAMLHLSEIWPRYIPVANLRYEARQRLNGGSGGDDATPADDLKVLGQYVVAAYTSVSSRRIVDLQISAPRYIVDVCKFPVCSSLARFQAALSNRVTNMRHETVLLEDLGRQVLLHADGTRDRSALLDVLSRLVDGGSLVIKEKGEPVQSMARVREILELALERELSRLAQVALLVS